MGTQYSVHNYPKSRIGTFDVGRISQSRHQVIGLVEADVTVAREKISRLKKSNSPVSFTSWVIKCIGDTVHINPLIHGVKKGKRKIITFDQVDVSIIVEREINSVPVPVPYIIRDVNNKSVSEIHGEIKIAREQLIRDEGDYVLGKSGNRIMMRFYYALPGPVRRLAWKIILASPGLVKKMMGTVVVSSVGNVGSIKGWIVPKSLHPLCFAISPAIKKPGVVNDEILIREYLPITVLIDHDVIDGSPAVRIINQLIHFMENAHLL